MIEAGPELDKRVALAMGYAIRQGVYEDGDTWYMLPVRWHV